MWSRTRSASVSTFRRRLWLEALEDRRTPASFLVTNIANTGAGSLRDAITQANGLAGTDTIIFDTAGLFATPQTINLSTGQIAISQALFINGTGTANLTIANTQAAGTTSRVFSITADTTISGLTITGGNLTGTGRGAGILSTAPNLVLNNLVVTNNTAAADDGAGIAINNTGGFLTITNSAVTGNKALGAASDGGGIRLTNNGKLLMDNCSVSGNVAGRNGGGVYFFSGGQFTVTNSTFDGNVANSTTTSFGGGGINFVGAATGPLLISNSTFSGNSTAKNAGGGICMGGTLAFTGALTIQNSTIASNSATTDGGGLARIKASAGAITLQSTLIAQNTSPTTPDVFIDVPGPIAGNFNLIGVGDVGGFSLPGIGNQKGTLATPINALLGALANNGGTTQTRLPLPGSPAIDTGNNFASLPFDQRGTGFSRANGYSDVGAVEAPSVIPGAAASTPNVTVGGGTSQTITVVYNDDAGINTGSFSDGDITVTGPGGPSGVTFAGFVGGGTSVTATYTMVPPGGSWDGADNGNYVISMNANEVFDSNANPVPARALSQFAVVTPLSIVVNATNDELVDTDGKVSLREAVLLANATTPSADTITFDPVVFASPQTIVSAKGQYVLTDALTITGPAAKVTLNGNAADRLFDTLTSANGTIFVFSNMTLTNGKRSGSTLNGVDNGGAIRIGSETVTFNNCALINNTTTGTGGAIGLGAGGTFAEPGGKVTLNDCVVSGNTVVGSDGYGFGDGGGISVNKGAGDVVLNRTTMSGNSCVGAGGAIYWAYNGGLNMDASTISGNTAGNAVGGGALYFFSTVPTTGFSITNSTISGNKATTGPGGAIALNTFIGTAFIRNSTIVRNDAKTTGGGIDRIISPNGFFALESTILAQNTVAGVAANAKADLSSDTALTITANSNIIGIQDAATKVTLLGVGNQTGTLAKALDPLLGPLQNNGGPTFTHSPLTGSPAIDQGNNAAGLTSDQRLAPFVRAFNGAADVGALEVQNVAPIITPLAPVSIDEGSTLMIAVSVTDVDVPAQTLTFSLDAPPSWATIDSVSGVITISPTDGPANSTTLTVRVTDNGSPVQSSTAPLAVTVNNVVPVINAGGDTSIGVPGVLSRSGSFFDPGADTWTAFVDYGDGSGKQSLPLSGMSFSLDHQYVMAGKYTVTVSIADDDMPPGQFSTATFVVTIVGGAPNIKPRIEGSNLYITADNSANDIKILGQVGSVTVISNLTNIGTFAVAGNITLNCGTADDTVTICVNSGQSLPGTVTVFGSGGNDVVNVQSSAATPGTINNLTLQLGEGNNSVVDQGVKIAQNWTIGAGNGNDKIGPLTSPVGSILTMTLSNGNNSATVLSKVGNQVRYTGGTGTDALNVGGSNSYYLLASLGAGNDTFTFQPGSSIGSGFIDFGLGTDTYVPNGVFVGTSLLLLNL